MNDRYLWDRSGEPDPEIAHLERLLQPFAHDGRAFNRARAGRTPGPAAWRPWIVPLALAASVVLLVGTMRVEPGGAAASWTLARLAGGVTVGSHPAGLRDAFEAGPWLQTDAAGRVRLQAAGVGTIDVGPLTRLRVLDARPGRHVFALAAGVVDADISTPPGAFVIDTPAARAIDLGCRYTLQVDGQGRGMLHVTLGWVALDFEGRQALVPAGALCATRAARGPGTPWFEGATPSFVAALAALDGGPAGGHDAALNTLLAEARPLDALTLWHLLTRLDRPSAARVHDRLASIAPPPPSVSRDAVLGGEAAALAAWWEAIGFGRLEELREGLAKAR